MTARHRRIRRQILRLFQDGIEPESMRELHEHRTACRSCEALYERLALLEEQTCSAAGEPTAFALERVQRSLVEQLELDAGVGEGTEFHNQFEKRRRTMFLKRITIASGLAGTITVGLFLAMMALIDQEELNLSEEPDAGTIDFVRIPRETETQKKVRPLPQRVSPATPEPPPMQLQTAGGDGGPGVRVSVTSPEVDKRVVLDGRPSLLRTSSDSDIVPLVRVEPIYPRRAVENGIQGWVEVRFSINETGAVEEARVTAAQPPGIFDAAALRAIRKWKYRAKVVNGLAQKREGVDVRLSFVLDGVD